jgi:hypothetical protein
MKSLTGLTICCIQECSKIAGVNADDDIKYVISRCENEGLSFLTITLPSFGSDFETSLSRGYVDSDLFHGFKWTGGLPSFLRGFLRRVFHPRSGRIHAKPCVEAVRFIRQICHLLKKVELPCTPEREKAALDRYLRVEEELRTREDSGEWTDADYVEFSRMAVFLFGSPLSVVDQMVYNSEILPKHGPGKVSDKLEGNQKWTLPTWTERLEGIFPYVDFGLPNHRYWEMNPEYLPPESEPPVKVVMVPKTLKTPRVIAVEPTHMQYMQQGLLIALVQALEGPHNPFPVLGFSDQLPNQELARRGSLQGDLATIDLSDASDRVLNSLVMNGLVRRFPWLRKALDATRSRTSVMPDGTLVGLRKFASMGSAVCFPIEALVFATIAMMGVQRSMGRSLTKKDLKSLLGSVRVYGDDIIVPTVHANHVVEELTRFGLAVNHSKSFLEGNFRESCGGDFFLGEWVTPIRCKKDLPRSWSDAAGVASWVELSNNLHLAGYWETAQAVQTHIHSIVGQLPTVPWQSGAIGLHSFTGVDLTSAKMDADLHVPLVRALKLEDKVPSSPLDGPAALLKCFRFDWSDPVDSEHLLAAGRPDPKKRKLRRRWVSAV